MGDGRWETGDGRREMGDGRWETGDGRWLLPCCWRVAPDPQLITGHFSRNWSRDLYFLSTPWPLSRWISLTIRPSKASLKDSDVAVICDVRDGSVRVAMVVVGGRSQEWAASGWGGG